jgi:pimeloyl-ACP methyl ester carboxylesterase
MSAAILLALLVVGMPLAVTVVLYAASAGRRGDTGVEPLHAVGTAGAFLREWIATAVLLAASLVGEGTHRSDPQTGRMVILIPERFCTGATFWHLRRRLHACGWSSRVGIRRLRGTDGRDVSTALDARMATLPNGTELVILGHGIGGLVALRYAQDRPALHVRHVITLGTPHQGSRSLPYRLLGAAAAPPSPAAKDGTAVDVIAVYSDFDAWLQPVDSAYCPGGFNIAVRGVGHCAMLWSRRVGDLIVENLTAAPPKSA